jgi:hypothetical protein
MVEIPAPASPRSPRMVMTDDDLEARLRRLEAMMQWRGYRRHPEHGFWVLPGAELAPLPQGDIEDDND